MHLYFSSTMSLKNMFCGEYQRYFLLHLLFAEFGMKHSLRFHYNFLHKALLSYLNNSYLCTCHYLRAGQTESKCFLFLPHLIQFTISGNFTHRGRIRLPLEKYQKLSLEHLGRASLGPLKKKFNWRRTLTVH